MSITWSCAGLSIPWNQPERSLSELANEADIEIVSACGGKSICSTCKVQVKEGGEFLSRRSDAEERIAQRLKWDDSIRLSCATKKTGNGTVVLKLLIKPLGEKKETNDAEGLRKHSPPGHFICRSERIYTTFRTAARLWPGLRPQQILFDTKSHHHEARRRN